MPMLSQHHISTQLALSEEKWTDHSKWARKESSVFTFDSDIFVRSPQTKKTLNNASGQSGCRATSLKNLNTSLQLKDSKPFKNHQASVVEAGKSGASIPYHSLVLRHSVFQVLHHLLPKDPQVHQAQPDLVLSMSFPHL